MIRNILKMLLCLVVTVSSQGILHSQIRIIPQQYRDSLQNATRKLSSDPSFVFDSLTLNYGSVKENDARIKKVFHFVYKGKSVVTISGITTSCSCVTATASRMTLKPGESCDITAIYNQKGHPGRHDRYLYLYVSENGGRQSKMVATLLMTGVVVSTDIALEGFPVNMGFFAADKSSLRFNIGVPSKQSVIFVNLSDQPRGLSVIDGLLPPGFLAKFSSKTASPGQSIVLSIIYDGDKSNHVSKRSIPIVIEGTGLNRLNSKIDIFFGVNE